LVAEVKKNANTFLLEIQWKKIISEYANDKTKIFFPNHEKKILGRKLC